jgi:hypothetical protein
MFACQHWPSVVSTLVALAAMSTMTAGAEPDSLGVDLTASELTTVEESIPPVPFVSGRPVTLDRDRSAVWKSLDSLELFGGIDGSKQPQDFGINAQLGGRIHVNWGAPLIEGCGLGFQIGTAGNVSDHAVRVTSQIEGAGSRTQSFTTVGLFQRSVDGWTWGLVHDFLFERDYDRFSLSQWRAQIGFEISESDEVGLFGMAPQTHDRGAWGPVSVRLDPILQGNLYWRHTWEHDAQTGIWLGIAEGHGRANVALGVPSDLENVLVFGADLHVPLNDSWALFGQANFICPADTGTVDAFLGFAWYPGHLAKGWRRRAFSPVLPVANNTSFSVDLSL